MIRDGENNIIKKMAKMGPRNLIFSGADEEQERWKESSMEWSGSFAEWAGGCGVPEVERGISIRKNGRNS